MKFVKFVTINGATISYHPDHLVAALDGTQRVARDVPPSETVWVQTWCHRTGRTREVQALRDEACWRRRMRLADGSGVPEHAPAKRDDAAPVPPPAPTRRGQVQRGSATVTAEGGRIALHFGPAVLTKVRNFHRAAALGMLAVELDGVAEVKVFPKAGVAVVPADAVERAWRIVQNYLSEHGFAVTRAA